MPSLKAAEVKNAIDSAERASKSFNKSSIKERKRVLHSLLRWILDNNESIAALAARDSGKTSTREDLQLSPSCSDHGGVTVLDGFLGEILVTAEKLRWTIDNLEDVLAPDHRS